MKCILIIGGANDIGNAIANSFTNLGYHVVIGYHNHLPIQKNYDYHKCDVTKEQDIQEIIEYCLAKYHHIDILLNLANINQDNSFLNKTKEEFMRVLEVNLVGTFLLNQYYSRYIDNGLIINMASTDGLDTGSTYSIDYSASKSGIITMSKIISIKVNSRVLICISNKHS
jgi:NAD(P)-dependent dehydrogenase (short-subunit alcohol dehydrogenase family)